MLRIYQYTHISHVRVLYLMPLKNHTHNECFEFLFNCRSETQAWDLQSLPIKPVQRVLKYPLADMETSDNTLGQVRSIFVR